MLRRRERE